jgi:hypothetical protein
MNNSKNSEFVKWIKIFRLIVCILAWMGIIIRIIIGIFDIIGGADPFSYFGNSLSYYTLQTNLMVAIWLIIAIVLGEQEERPLIMHPIIHGAICLYITTTFLIFAIFLSGGYQPTGIEAISNILMHYIVPVAFILEWIFSEIHTKYKYIYLLYYSIYPFAYVFYTVIRGFFTGFYPYYFFDLNTISPISLAINVILLVILFTIIGSIYITINRLLYISRLN